MEQGLIVQPGIEIPLYEIEIIASRSGGAGGQHVNKTSTRITLHWNVVTTTALNAEQKSRVMQKLQSRLTNDGVLVIHSDETRSQQQNKERAFLRLAGEIRDALHTPKQRKKTKVSRNVKEARLQSKMQRSSLKKLRKVKIRDYE